jgi:hypothetical protein
MAVSKAPKRASNIPDKVRPRGHGPIFSSPNIFAAGVLSYECRIDPHKLRIDLHTWHQATLVRPYFPLVLETASQNIPHSNTDRLK